MINTYDYFNCNNTGLQILAALRHPIYFIKTFRDEMYAWPSLAGTIRKKWMWLYTRLPLQKACRWLGHELIYRVYDSKLLDTFECRTRGKVTKYYFANCKFGRIKFFEKTYIRDGKTCNIFLDCFVTTLVDEKQGKKNAEQTKTEVKMIYKGWVFTKKKAFKLLKEIINNNKDIFAGTGKDKYKYPDAFEPWVIEKADEMYYLLCKGSLKTSHIYDTCCSNIFNETDDSIIKLYAFVADLLHSRNDWYGAHYELAEILATCDNYTYHKEFLKNPMVDYTYQHYIEQGCEEEAKKYYEAEKKFYAKLDKSCFKELVKRIGALKDKWLEVPYDYYRC